MKRYDITRTLTPSIAVWPGDQPFETGWTARIEDGSSVNIGVLTMSTHTGTHVDAPLHYRAGDAAVEAYPLDAFIGPAIVVALPDVSLILPHHLDGIDFKRFPRVLFKTAASEVADAQWEPRFPAIAPETVDRLGAAGVVLLGTDAPSVDPVDSQTLAAHHRIAHYGIANLENLLLREVPAGTYRLVALPMKVAGMDAAPVRAVLEEV